MHGKLAALEARSIAASDRTEAATKQLAAIADDAAAAKVRVKQLLEVNEHLKGAAAAEADWRRRNAQTAAMEVTVGVVTPEVRLLCHVCWPDCVLMRRMGVLEWNTGLATAGFDLGCL